MRKILFVSTGLAYGGAETQLKEVAIRLKQRGWGVRVVSLLPPAAYVEELQQAGIHVDSLQMRRKVPDPRALLRLARIIREERPDVVHAYMFHANLIARFVRLLAPVPVLVCSIRSLREGGWFRERAYQVTDWLADITTHVSQRGLERYVCAGVVPVHRIEYIPNGVDLSRFAPNPQERPQKRHTMNLHENFVWLAVGRLEAPKDYPLMLNAFHQVYRQFPQARLLIIGDGMLRLALERQIADIELVNAVQLLGIRQDVPDWMRIADAYVMSSAWEGMPNVLLEAHASGLPVVCTDVGGCAEIVQHRVSGFLVPPGDADALAQAMIQMMSLSEAERQAMGQAGRAHVMANFEIEQVVSRWEALYCEWIERKACRK